MKWSLEAGRDYIDHCVDTVAAIDPEEFATRSLDSLVGANSKDAFMPTATYSIGQVLLKSGPLDIAIKKVTEPRLRMNIELTDAAFLLSRAPELAPKLPFFMGVLSVNEAFFGSGIITEDASRGGTVNVYETRMSPETMRLLKNVCRDVSFDQHQLERHTTFDADGEERILDLFASVFGHRWFDYVENHEEIAAIYRKVRESADNLTIEIPEDSALANSLGSPPTYRTTQQS